MIVTVHNAGAGAAAHLHGVGPHGLRLALLGPRPIAAEALDRRPIRHRGRRLSIVKARKIARAIDDASTDHGQPARDVRDLVLGAGESDRPLTFYEGRLKPTQDWTRIEVVFNSLEEKEVRVGARVGCIYIFLSKLLWIAPNFDGSWKSGLCPCAPNRHWAPYAPAKPRIHYR